MRQLAWISKRLGWCIVLLVPLRALAFDFEDLTRMIRDEQLDSVAAVIEHLPLEYRENYTLGYHSQSLQGSSHDNPRAILFGRTAQMVLTFNGDPGQRHYHAIEVMQFREDSNTFDLYSIDLSGSKARVIGPDPEICAGCHGTPPHPIWSSYEYGEKETSHWPGFYGSTHDAPILSPEEKAAFEHFKELARKHPRYRHLVLDKANDPWFPYGTGPLRHSLRPNNRLGNLLARWHARQIVALIRQNEFTDHHPDVADAWLLRCPATGDEPYRRRVRELFDATFPAADHKLAHEMLDKLPPDRRTAFMMEKLLTGSDSFDWDMTIQDPESSGRFFTGIVTIDELVGARWMSTLGSDHWLKRYFKPWSSRDLYNTFQDGYYAANVEPGGVGAAYDSVMNFYDESRAQLACPGVMRAALSKVETVSK